MALETTQERIRPVTGTHVVRVQHEGLVTADAERSRDFYCRVLGFQVLPRPAFSSHGYWLGTPGIFPQIHLIQSDMVPPGAGAPISPLGRHTCFEVADYSAMKATLEREGIAYVENRQPGGGIQMLCNDPDGNTLEFQPATVCSAAV
ncbi:MAG TPA: VOC family protein [Methylomirabilota bacterium]|nr:VOC family protein [Methylomirabilota bacterium]